MNDYEITLYSKIGDVEHVMGPFRRRARTTGGAIAAEMRYGQWDADVVQVRAELVSRLTPVSNLPTFHANEAQLIRHLDASREEHARA